MPGYATNFPRKKCKTEPHCENSSVPNPRGAWGGMRSPPPRSARECPKNTQKQLFCHVLLIEKVRGHRQICDLDLQIMGLKIPYSRVAEDITLLYPPKQNSKTGGGALIPSSKAVGLEYSLDVPNVPLFHFVVACIANIM